MSSTAQVIVAHKRAVACNISAHLPALDVGNAELLRQTLPALRKQATAVIARFYELLFERHAELRVLFNTDRTARGAAGAANVPAQVARLARTIMQYAMRIEDAAALVGMVRTTAHRHVARGVSPESYEDFGVCLVDALRDVLGLEEKSVAAWRQAYARLAALFRAVEGDVRAEAASRSGYSEPIEMRVDGLALGSDKRSGGKILIVSAASGNDGLLEDAPDARAGMFCAIRINDAPNIGRCMLTAVVRDTQHGTLALHVPDNGDAANNHLLATVRVGDRITVGLLCGEVDNAPTQFG